MKGAVLSVATRCASREDFLKLFQKYVDRRDGSLFIVAKETRPVGSRAPFQIKLQDGSIVLRGAAEVVRTFTGNDGPTGKRGYSVKLSDLDEASRSVYKELVGRSRQAAPPPPPAPAPAPPVVPAPLAARRKSKPPTTEPSVVVDLDAGGPKKTPLPEMIPALIPPDGVRRVAVREGCEVWVARQDAADGPPWVREKRYDPRHVTADKVATRVGEASGVVHGGLARFLESGATPDGQAYVVSEWLLGRPLAEVTHRITELGTPIPPIVAAAVTAQAARSMAAAHEASVFHGCLTPANVIVGFDGRVVVTDLVGAVDTIVMGAPLDGREDVLALCAIFREMLGADAPAPLLNVISTVEEMDDLAGGLEKWLGGVQETFGPEELSQLVVRLCAPKGALATGWHVVIGGDPYGPLSFEELLDTMYRLYVGDPMRVWHDGLERWAVVVTIPRVMDLVDELGG